MNNYAPFSILKSRIGKKINYAFLMAGTAYFMFLIIPSCQLEAQSTYYIDPSLGGSGGNGTMDNPYHSWFDVQWTDGSAYLQKRGTDFHTTKSVLVWARNVTFDAYGEGPKPIIRDVSDNSYKILDVFQKGNFTIRNFEIISDTKVSSTCAEFKGNENISIDSCIFHGSDWGIRFLFNKGTMKINRSVVYDTYDDGIYIKDNAPGEGEYSLRDSVHIQYSNIYDVNRGHYEDPDGPAGGDCLQLDDINGFYINNNILDRSLTDIKFCLIVGECGYGLVEENHFIGYGPGMSNMYIHETKEMMIRYNLFDNATYGIFNSSGKHIELHYNIFNNHEVSYSGNQNDGSFSNIYNNLFMNAERAIIAWKPVRIYNNIFYNMSGMSIYGANDIVSDNNCYYNAEPRLEKNSVLESPMFMNASAGDFRLQDNSPCIDKGVDNPKVFRDLSRHLVPYNSKTDIGVYEWIDENDVDYADQFEIISDTDLGGFTISTSFDTVTTDIDVYDISGRILYKLKDVDINQSHFNLRLPKGLIILKFKTVSGLEETHKLVVL